MILNQNSANNCLIIDINVLYLNNKQMGNDMLISNKFNKEHLAFLKSSKIKSNRVVKLAKQGKQFREALLDYRSWLQASDCTKTIVEQHMYYLKEELNKLYKIV